ncbi:MAG TPA: diguanylate cyclase [Marinobacterium sp.]|nr:diguanylate cyclase [Marinobacterium sp.]
MKALIADDDLALRFIMQKMLEGWGFEPVIASDGEAALRIMEESEEPPRLLLLDWEMPKINGLDLCKRLRTVDTSDPPYIILVTGHAEAEYIQTALDAGANDFVSKPTNSGVLRARIGVGLRTLELQRRLNIANHMLAYRADHDELTGLRNRGAVVERLESELARAQRTNASLAIAILDIDFFKQVNDTFGHPIGDRVLREFADRLRDTFRPYDIVGRYGGEEFIAICPVEQEKSFELFERFRAVVEGTPFLADDLAINVTVSIGVRTLMGNEAKGSQPILALLADADAALYRAKHSGRNSVCMVDHNVTPFPEHEHLSGKQKSVS